MQTDVFIILSLEGERVCVLLKKSLLLQKPFFSIIYPFFSLFKPWYLLSGLCTSSCLPLNCVLSLVINTPSRHRRENKSKKNGPMNNDKWSVGHEDSLHTWSLKPKSLKVASSDFFRKGLHLLPLSWGNYVLLIMCMQPCLSGMVQKYFT